MNFEPIIVYMSHEKRTQGGKVVIELNATKGCFSRIWDKGFIEVFENISRFNIAYPNIDFGDQFSISWTHIE